MPKVGLISGVFDLLHEGHIHLLKTAIKQVNLLYVVVNCDEYVRKRKGEGRPIEDEETRAYKVSCSGYADIVYINYEDSPLSYVKRLKPDIIFVGDDYTEETTVGAKEIKEWGGKVVIIPRVGGYSTTSIIKSRQ